MKLNTILKKINLKKSETNYKISHFTRDKNDIKKNTLYITFETLSLSDINSLKEKGVVYILGQEKVLNNSYQKVESIIKTYQEILYLYNKHKLRNKILIGITGTNGKTTISTNIFNFLKKDAIYYGSNGIYDKDNYYYNDNTTPSMEVFFKHLKHQKYVIVEISSISFFEYRLYNIKFDYLLLTNISEEHLEYHESFLDYKYTKYLILASNPKASTIICESITDDKILRLNENIIYYGFNKSIFSVYYNENELILTDNIYQANINVKGMLKYNVLNLLGSITILYILGYSLEIIEDKFKTENQVPGRFEVLSYKNKTIIIDYPHTIYAYRTLFEDLYEKYKGDYVVVFGAGGQRQKTKRFEYAKIVSKYAKTAIITDDNPRKESSIDIISDISANMTIPYLCIPNRKEAIDKALSLLEEHDFLLVLGKGIEEYIDYGSEKLKHNDILYIKEKLNG